MKKEDDQNPKRSWDLMIGISMTILGSFRLYKQLQEENILSFDTLFRIFFVLFGIFLIFRHFRNSSKK